jgi:hypothetical protein
MENSMEVSQKLKTDLLCDPVILHLGIHLKQCKPEYDRVTYPPMFIAVLFTIAKLWKQCRCPTTEE